MATTTIIAALGVAFFLVMFSMVLIVFLRDRNMKRVTGKILATFITEHGNEYECLCDLNGFEVVPPTDKEYKKLTGRKREGMPGTYFIGPAKAKSKRGNPEDGASQSSTAPRAPITTVKYPRGLWHGIQVQAINARFREIHAFALNPYGHEEVVNPIIVKGKLSEVVSRQVAETAQSTWDDIKEVMSRIETLKSLNPSYIYFGLFVIAVITVGLGVYMFMGMGESTAESVIEKLRGLGAI